jgi:hypothetical protein
MKIRIFSKAVLGLVLAGSALFISSCKKDKNDDSNAGKMYAVSGNGSGGQVVPVVASSASSTLTGTYNSSSNQLQYTINWSGLAATASAVRFYGPASAGANASGNSQFDLAITTPGVSGTASGTITLNAAQETNLLNGSWYYTVSDATYITGEVRGQVTTVVQ